MPDGLREVLATIVKVAESIRDDKGLSEAVKAKADRIAALAETCLSMSGEDENQGGH